MSADSLTLLLLLLCLVDLHLAISLDSLTDQPLSLNPYRSPWVLKSPFCWCEWLVVFSDKNWARCFYWLQLRVETQELVCYLRWGLLLSLSLLVLVLVLFSSLNEIFTSLPSLPKGCTVMWQATTIWLAEFFLEGHGSSLVNKLVQVLVK
jgi:hypothetical protein